MFYNANIENKTFLGYIFITSMGQRALKNEQLLEYQHLLLLRDLVVKVLI
jgi:hypothetical protein